MDELSRNLLRILQRDDQELLSSIMKPKIKADKEGNVTVPVAKLQEIHDLLLSSQDLTASLNTLVKELIIKLTQKNLLSVSDIVPIHRLSLELNLSMITGVTNFHLCVPLEPSSTLSAKTLFPYGPNDV